MAQTKETAPNTGKKRLAGWTRVLLFGSLAVNLLIAGMVAGAVFRNTGERADGRELRDMGFGFFGAALSGGDRRAIGQEMAKNSTVLRANRQHVRDQMVHFLSALRAVPYDRDMVSDLSGALQSKLADRQRVGQNVLLDRIAAMSDKQRAAYANRLERSMKRGPRRN